MLHPVMDADDGVSFTVSSFRLTGIVLLLFLSCGVQSDLIGSHQPIVALAGDDVILPCHLEPAVSASSDTVAWTKPGLVPKYVHVHRDGRLMFENQNPSFFDRTRLFENEFMNGNVSMKIFKVQISDAGEYFCSLDSLQKAVSVQLTVGAVSMPTIKFVSTNSAEVVFQCESAGWYPEPEVFWLDGEGNLLSAEPPETVRGPDDLYTVSSRVTVEKRHDKKFTCRVHQKNINQTRETQIYVHVPDGLFVTQSSVYIISGLAVTVFIICVSAVGFLLWRRNKRNIRWQQEAQTDIMESQMSSEVHLLNEGERDGWEPMTGEENMYFNKKMDELHEELRWCTVQCKDVEQAVKRLTKYKNDLVNEVEQLTLQSISINKQIDDNKLKMAGAQTQYEIDKYQDDITDLEKRKEANVTLLQEKKKLIQRTEDEVNKKIEKKIELEKRQEEINKCLEELTLPSNSADCQQ